MNTKTTRPRHPNTVLEVIVGSTLHGTAVDDGLEDLDLMAIVVETPKEFIGFGARDTWTWRTKPEGVRSEKGDVDLSVYGLRRYLSLTLSGNPTMVLALFAPQSFFRYSTSTGLALQKLAPQIISKQSFATFRGYMRQQHERLLGLRGQRNVTRPELVNAYGYDTKYAAHIIRLGLQGVELLTTGQLTLPMRESERQLVRDVRNGKFNLVTLSDMIQNAEKNIVEANERSPLPAAPNYKIVQEWMVKTYLTEWALAEYTNDEWI